MEAAELVQQVAKSLREEGEPTREQENEFAASAVEVIGGILISVEQSLDRIAHALEARK